MSAREGLATAASTVAGVKVAAWYQQSSAPGHGFVSFQRSEIDDTGLGFMDRWAITIVLPQDLLAAEKWIEENRDQLVAALAPVLIVTAIVPATLVLDQGSVPGLVVEGSLAH